MRPPREPETTLSEIARQKFLGLHQCSKPGWSGLRSEACGGEWETKSVLKQVDEGVHPGRPLLRHLVARLRLVWNNP